MSVPETTIFLHTRTTTQKKNTSNHRVIVSPTTVIATSMLTRQQPLLYLVATAILGFYFDISLAFVSNRNNNHVTPFAVLAPSSLLLQSDNPRHWSSVVVDSTKPMMSKTTSSTTMSTTTALQADVGGGEAGVSMVLSVAQSDPALVAGFVMICMATSPYVLGVFLPRPLFQSFFVPIYKDDTKDDVEKARNAEIYWKLLYTTLGLYLTVQSFGEAVTMDLDPIDILKDSYIGWAVFYTIALIKIRYEAVELDILDNSRVGIQIWHALVVIVLWLSVAGNRGLITAFDLVFDWDKLVDVVYQLFGE